jgi:5'-methylthioadenosine phosphorylase
LEEAIPPGMFVFVDQFIDRTFAREKSFFGNGCVAHVSVADPVCNALSSALYAQALALGIPARLGGTYLAMEGPQFSTRAESLLYRQWGCQVIGMTNMPEAKLAREAELCYAAVAMATDYDCWHDAHGHVTVDAVLKVMEGNSHNAKRLLAAAVPALAAATTCTQNCAHALDYALITAPHARDAALLAKLDAVAGRVLRS